MKRIKKLKTCIITAVMAAGLAAPPTAGAVSAYPGIVEFRQPDGRIVHVRMCGDEFQRWAETEDGYSLVYGDNGALMFADLAKNGDMVASMLPARDPGERTPETKKFLAEVGLRLQFSEAQLSRATDMRMKSAPANAGVPKKMKTTGTIHMPVILVEYADVKFSNTVQDFDRMMNEEGCTIGGNHGSVRDFFKENSFGKLDLVTDVIGIYTLPEKRAYYGGNDWWDNDNDPRAMVATAIGMADKDIDFSKFDNDGDGVVDGIHVIFAGPGEEAGGGKDCIWSHSWDVNSSADGVRFSRYSCSPEVRGPGGTLLSYIGVVCHELGHVLGAMDFYDTDYSCGGRYEGTGEWDLMASGSWNGDGACPAHFNPYSKIYDFGWAVAAEGGPGTYNLKAFDDNGFVRIDSPTDGEYFLLEYRAKKKFDSHLPGQGMMVYHASGNLSRLGFNTINASHRQQFYPVCANSKVKLPDDDPDSYGLVDHVSAPFPGGSLGKHELSDVTVPSLMGWDYVPTAMPITDIAVDYNGDCVTFDIAGGLEGGAYGLKVSDSGLDFVSVEWKKKDDEDVMLAYSLEPNFGMPEAREYKPGESLPTSGKVLYEGGDRSFRHTGLDPQTTYHYKLFTRKSDGEWTSGRLISGKTITDVIRKFPYSEDFESGKNVLEAGWRQEYIFSDKSWTVDDVHGRAIRALTFCAWDENKVSDDVQSTRIIFPPIDFSEAHCAYISMDARNFLRSVEVQYRSSASDIWHTLAFLPSNVDELDISYKDDDDYVESERNHKFALPSLSPEYELALVADFVERDNCLSSDERCTIDNIEIVTDFDSFVMLEGICPGSTEIAANVFLIEGNGDISSYGAEWTSDGKEWHKVAAEDGRVVISGLDKSHTYTLRGYTENESGATDVYDQVLVTTLNFEGNGREDSPFLISSDSDWNNLCDIVNKGNDCEGHCFAVTSSFEADVTMTKPFGGILDGRDHTLSFSNGVSHLIYALKKNGALRNLKIGYEEIALYTYETSGVCGYNYGTIEHVDVSTGLLRESRWYNFGGICYKNYGCISCCSSIINGMTDGMTITDIGGICWHNYGWINDCESYGSIYGCNNSSLGGIACTNFEGGIVDGKIRGGLISNCRSHMNIEMRRSDGECYYVDAGGIAGSNYGEIRDCVYSGNLTTDSEGGTNYAGGIAGSNYPGIVINCVNRGKILLDGQDGRLQAGGICGYGSRSKTMNCLLAEEMRLNTTLSDSIHSIVGHNDEAAVQNCLYAGPINDILGKPMSSSAYDDLAVLGNHYCLDVNGKLALKVETGGMKSCVDYIMEAGKDRASFRWAASGDGLTECGLEWRKQGDFRWNYIEGVCGYVNPVDLTSLRPFTLYEVRVTGVCKGEREYSDVETFATYPESTGRFDDPIIIKDRGDLLAFAGNIACSERFSGKSVKLASDIDLKGSKGFLWEPMMSRYNRDGYGFSGDFDGQGHVIRDMKVDVCDCYAGFFGKFHNGKVHDLEILDSEVRAYDYGAGVDGDRVSTATGVGGIVGLGDIVERCGFTGKITGSSSTGGISGAAFAYDCYSIAEVVSVLPELHSGLPSRAAGMVGDHHAENSWCVGTVERINPVKSMYLGPISASTAYAGIVKDNINSYHDVKCIPYSTYTRGAMHKSSSDMKKPEFLDRLTSGVWTQHPDVNDGLPMFARRGPSRVTTLGASLAGKGKVMMEAMFTPGVNGECRERGIQWFAKRGDGVAVIDTRANTKTPVYSVSIDTDILTMEGVVFRAYAIMEKDSVFGEWKSFRLDDSPTASISGVSGKGKTSATVRYVLSGGLSGIEKASLDYWLENNPSQVIAKAVKVEEDNVTIDGLDENGVYVACISIRGIDGSTFESDHVRWIQGLTDVGELESGEDALYDVYSTEGMLVATGLEKSSLRLLQPGVYVVSDGKSSRKVAVH